MKNSSTATASKITAFICRRALCCAAVSRVDERRLPPDFRVVFFVAIM